MWSGYNSKMFKSVHSQGLSLRSGDFEKSRSSFWVCFSQGSFMSIISLKWFTHRYLLSESDFWDKLGLGSKAGCHLWCAKYLETHLIFHSLNFLIFQSYCGVSMHAIEPCVKNSPVTSPINYTESTRPAKSGPCPPLPFFHMLFFCSCMMFRESDFLT